jgi:hypothetical protein
LKVVRVSNYDDPGPRGTERVVAGPGLSTLAAAEICLRMCDDPRRSIEDWYVVKRDDYQPRVFELFI